MRGVKDDVMNASSGNHIRPSWRREADFHLSAPCKLSAFHFPVSLSIFLHDRSSAADDR
jgi:hypothetical protein